MRDTRRDRQQGCSEKQIGHEVSSLWLFQCLAFPVCADELGINQYSHSSPSGTFQQPCVRECLQHLGQMHTLPISQNKHRDHVMHGTQGRCALGLGTIHAPLRTGTPAGIGVLLALIPALLPACCLVAPRSKVTLHLKVASTSASSSPASADALSYAVTEKLEVFKSFCLRAHVPSLLPARCLGAPRSRVPLHRRFATPASFPPA